MSGMLVVYAIKNGSAKSVAEAIATELRGSGATAVTRIGSSNGTGKISSACRSPYSEWDRGKTGRSHGSERGSNWTAPWRSDPGWHQPRLRSSAGLIHLAAATVTPGEIFVTGRPSAAGRSRWRTAPRDPVVIGSMQTADRDGFRCAALSPGREPVQRPPRPRGRR